jgi:hypothetical protein
MQLDVEVVFDYPDITNSTLETGAPMADAGHFEDCNHAGGAAHRGVYGPFGLLVLADENLHEQTAVFFYISYSRRHGRWATRFCSDHTR